MGVYFAQKRRQRIKVLIPIFRERKSPAVSFLIYIKTHIPVVAAWMNHSSLGRRRHVTSKSAYRIIGIRVVPREIVPISAKVDIGIFYCIEYVRREIWKD